MTCLLFIGLGPCLYWLFGVNRIKTHAKRMTELGYWKHRATIPEHSRNRIPPKERSFHSRKYNSLLKMSEKVAGRSLTMGNRIEVLYNGEQAYPAMLGSIRKARRSVQLATYIFDTDEIGMEFVEALAQAKRRGTKVWVLVDAFGEHYSLKPVSRSLRARGIEMRRFLPISPSLNSLHFNLRNHRKLLVVDGETGFTGGMNIRKGHLLEDRGGGRRMTDLHFRAQGPIVSELQKVFLEDWYFACRESLPWHRPVAGRSPGRAACRAVSGGPNEDFEKISWILMGALSWAQKNVRIMTPYFLPDRILISALNMAVLRGIQVEVILPRVNNLPFVGWANRAILGEMLEHGVRFYYQPPPFSHSKMFVVDGSYALIGSSNWDARSLRLNFELDLEVYDPRFAGELGRHFDSVKTRSEEITMEQVGSDPLPVKLRDSFMNLFSPYL